MKHLNLLRKQEIHRVLYVITVAQFEVFQKIRELKVQKSVKLSWARNPRRVFSSLATRGMHLKHPYVFQTLHVVIPSIVLGQVSNANATSQCQSELKITKFYRFKCFNPLFTRGTVDGRVVSIILP
jgi:hypothetical protein